MNPYRFLNWMSLLEGTSLILLFFVAMPLKYHYGMPEAVKVVGMAHGILFILFNLVLFSVSAKGLLSEMQAFKGFLGSLVPFGTFVFSATVIKRKQLAMRALNAGLANDQHDPIQAVKD